MGCALTPLHAQILKVDKGSIDSDSSNYFMGSFSLNFSLNNKSTTATEQVIYTGLEATGDVVYVGEKHAYMLINDIDYYHSTGSRAVSTGYAHGRVNLLRKKRLSYELFAQIQYDAGRNMPRRLLEGGGLRYRILKSKKTTLHAGTGIMWERENWESLTDDDVIIEKGIWKTTNYISSKFVFNENANLSIMAYYQGGYDDDDDVFRNRVSGDIIIGLRVTDRLAFNVKFTGQYEDKPIIDINKFVYSLTNGLIMKF